jgi:putative membrane protein
VFRLLATAAALWVATQLLPGITHEGSALSLLGVALVFGIVNALVGPVLKLLSLPVIVVTLGLFALVINALLLLLTSGLAGALGLGFHVDGFFTALLGSILISIVSALIMLVFGSDDSQQKRR